jgi:hypothetical protein
MGLVQSGFVFFGETGSSCVEFPWTSPSTTSCLPWPTRSPPGAAQLRHEFPPSFPPLFLLSLLSLLWTTAGTRACPPWPSPSAVVRRRPELLRALHRLRLDVLAPLAEGIGHGCLQSPPTTASSSQVPELTAVRFGTLWWPLPLLALWTSPRWAAPRFPLLSVLPVPAMLASGRRAEPGCGRGLVNGQVWPFQRGCLHGPSGPPVSLCGSKQPQCKKFLRLF